MFHTQLCHTHSLSHTPFTHTIFHTQFCHTPSFTHTFVTHTLFHTQLCHTPSFTHTTLSHILFHTQLCHTPSFTHNFVTHSLSHTTFSTSRPSTTSFVFPSFPVPLQHVLLIIGRSWLVGPSGPLISKNSLYGNNTGYGDVCSMIFLGSLHRPVPVRCNWVAFARIGCIPQKNSQRQF